MNNDVRDQMKRGRSVLAFKATHETLFSGPKSTALAQTITDALQRLADLGADQDQAGGSSLSGTAGINSLVRAVHDDLVTISGTARTIRKMGGQLDFPFDLPKGEAAQDTISAGEAFYRELKQKGVAAKFLEWEIAPDFLTDLRADLDAYEGKVQHRDNATQERKDAVREINQQEEKLINAIDALDTLFKNKLHADKVLYAAWKEAAKLVRTRVHPRESPTV